VRPARRTLAAAALKASRRRQTPAQGGFSRTIASRRASAAPTRKAASASLCGAFSARAQAGNAAGAAVEDPGVVRESPRAIDFSLLALIDAPRAGPQRDVNYTRSPKTADF